MMVIEVLRRFIQGSGEEQIIFDAVPDGRRNPRLFMQQEKLLTFHKGSSKKVVVQYYCLKHHPAAIKFTIRCVCKVFRKIAPVIRNTADYLQFCDTEESIAR